MITILKEKLSNRDFLMQWAIYEAERDGTTLGNFMQFYSKVYDKLYSQWSQDAFVWYIFNSMRGGRYFEIGAADGHFGSNTITLERELGWTGTLVEPSPSAFAALVQNRGSSNHCINAAAGPGSGCRSVRFLEAGELSCVVGREGEDQHRDARRKVGREIIVPQRSFSQMVLEAGPLDYLSLDVEGAELDLLRWLDWTRTQPPKVITVEHNWRSPARGLINEFLRLRGYVSFLEDAQWLTRGDFWFVHNTALTHFLLNQKVDTHKQ